MLCETRRIACSSALIHDGSEKGAFIRRLQNECCEGLPMSGLHIRISHREWPKRRLATHRGALLPLGL